MSMMGDKLLPCACEVDIAGVTAHVRAGAGQPASPAALIDWNNNYGEDRNKCVAQHCSNYPKSFVGETGGDRHCACSARRSARRSASAPSRARWPRAR